MNLFYRGVRYNANSAEATTSPIPVAVNYRGLTYRGVRHHAHAAEVAPKAAPVVAKYRGLTYRVPQAAIVF